MRGIVFDGNKIIVVPDGHSYLTREYYPDLSMRPHEFDERSRYRRADQIELRYQQREVTIRIRTYDRQRFSQHTLSDEAWTVPLGIGRRSLVTVRELCKFGSTGYPVDPNHAIEVCRKNGAFERAIFGVPDGHELPVDWESTLPW